MRQGERTERAEAALARAEDEARRLGHRHLGTEHQLLALLEAPAVRAVLEELEADPRAVRALVLDVMRPVRAGGDAERRRWSSRAKRVLGHASREARALGRSRVDVDHLLLGLLAEEGSVAAQVLGSVGLDLDAARRVVREEAGGEPASGPRRFRVRLDDASDATLPEQIVAQVREGVATGALRPGERLWPVRRLAERLDVAPGTVGRAYRELERLGVVETDGARGTRVADPREARRPPDDRHDALVGLLRPVAVAAFHMGASSGEVRRALGPAMEGILPDDPAP